MPGWHPYIVHFPIVLLPLSLVFDLAALVKGRPTWHTAAYCLLVAGTVAAAAAVISGNAAATPHRETDVVAAAIERHEDSGSLVLIAFIAVALGRLPLQLRQRTTGWPLKAWLAVAAAGCVLVWRTSLLGGDLVYEYGVGVRPGAAELKEGMMGRSQREGEKQPR